MEFKDDRIAVRRNVNISTYFQVIDELRYIAGVIQTLSVAANSLIEECSAIFDSRYHYFEITRCNIGYWESFMEDFRGFIADMESKLLRESHYGDPIERVFIANDAIEHYQLFKHAKRILRDMTSVEKPSFQASGVIKTGIEVYKSLLNFLFQISANILRSDYGDSKANVAMTMQDFNNLVTFSRTRIPKIDDREKP
jgi:hypothetical protein